jgi:hypothetical protein
MLPKTQSSAFVGLISFMQGAPMKDVTDRFQIRTADGKVHDAVEMRERIRTTTLEDKQEQFSHGLRSYQLIDGGPLNFIDEDTFEIVWTGEHAKRI